MENVIKMMKNGKATGSDEIPIEAVKVFDEHNLEVVTDLCDTIYNSGYIPTDMKQSIFVSLLKKPKAQKVYRISDNKPQDSYFQITSKTYSEKNRR